MHACIHTYIDTYIHTDIGVAKRLSLCVKSYGSEEDGLSSVEMTNIMYIEFDWR